MAQRYDVSLKTLFLREGEGIIRRLLFGTRVVEHLNVEQPQVFNHRADMVVRTEDGLLHQVEFQVSNEVGFGLRMLEYYSYLVRQYGEHVVQTVLYLGRETLRLEKGYRSPSIEFRFEVLDVKEFDAGVLLDSEDWADNVLALFARGDVGVAMEKIMGRLRGMQGEELGWAAGTLLLLSGILGLEETVGEKLKEVGMINVMENKVLGPMLQREYEKGVEMGVERGQELILLRQLAARFGKLPNWAVERVENAKPEELDRWAESILRAGTIEETLG